MRTYFLIKGASLGKRFIGGACLLLASMLSVDVSAQAISPSLVSNNLWRADTNTGETPSNEVFQRAKDINTRLIRIGGQKYDTVFPSKEFIEQWVLKIRAYGAEPIVQVSQYSSASYFNDRVAAAVNLVQYLNVTKGLNVKYWSIGNEPWLQMGSPTDHTIVASTVAATIREIAPAMKAVDSNIKIYGPDEAYFMTDVYTDLFNSGSANDIAGKIPNQNYYYIDGITWHSYPQHDANPAVEGAAALLDAVVKSKNLVTAANQRHNRVGNDALIWGVSEYNSKNGTQVHTFENGQMFGQLLGYAMKYSAEFAATWSMFESNGNQGKTDFSMINGDGKPRPSYYHMGFVSNYMSGLYADGVTNNSNIKAYGSVNGEQRTVMIMNRGTTAQNFTLRLNTDPISGTSVKININANSNQEYTSSIDANTTLVLVLNGVTGKKITYSKTYFLNGAEPTEELITTTAGAIPVIPTNIINGAFTGSAENWVLYSYSPNGNARDVRYENNLVRFYTDGTELNWHGQLYQRLKTAVGSTYTFSCDVETTGTNPTKVQLFVEDYVNQETVAFNTCAVAGDGVTRCSLSSTIPASGADHTHKFGVRLPNTSENLGWDFTVDNCASNIQAASSSISSVSSSAASSSLSSEASSSLLSSSLSSSRLSSSSSVAISSANSSTATSASSVASSVSSGAASSRNPKGASGKP